MPQKSARQKAIATGTLNKLKRLLSKGSSLILTDMAWEPQGEEEMLFCGDAWSGLLSLSVWNLD